MRGFSSDAVPRFVFVATTQFRRALGGYDRSQVDSAVAAAQSRIARLEADLASLANQLEDSQRRLAEALARLGEGDPTGTVAALTRAVEEVHDQARRQATRIRMRALEDAVAISDRISALAGIGSADQDTDSAFAKRPAAQFDSEDGAWSGRVEVIAGPISDFAQLTEIEDTLKGIDAVSSVSVRGVSDNRATLAVQVESPTSMVEEIRRGIPFEVALTAAETGALEIEIIDHDSGAAGGELRAA